MASSNLYVNYVTSTLGLVPAAWWRLAGPSGTGANQAGYDEMGNRPLTFFGSVNYNDATTQTAMDALWQRTMHSSGTYSWLTTDTGNNYASMTLGTQLDVEWSSSFSFVTWTTFQVNSTVHAIAGRAANNAAWSASQVGWGLYQPVAVASSAAICFGMNTTSSAGIESMSITGTWASSTMLGIGPTFIQTTVTYMIAVTYNGSGLSSGLKLYCNGREADGYFQTGTLTTGTIKSSAPFVLFRFNTGTTGINSSRGGVADAIFFTSSLSANNIKSLYGAYYNAVSASIPSSSILQSSQRVGISVVPYVVAASGSGSTVYITDGRVTKINPGLN